MDRTETRGDVVQRNASDGDGKKSSYEAAFHNATDSQTIRPGYYLILYPASITHALVLIACIRSRVVFIPNCPFTRSVFLIHRFVYRLTKVVQRRFCWTHLSRTDEPRSDFYALLYGLVGRDGCALFLRGTVVGSSWDTWRLVYLVSDSILRTRLV